MNEKFDLAEYLANLLSIMTSKESAGLPRGRTLTKEYNRVYNDFCTLLAEEKENEARTE